MLWVEPRGRRIWTLARDPFEALIFAADGTRRSQAMPAEGVVALAPGETLVLHSGALAVLQGILAELEGVVQLPVADASQLVALIEGAAGELATPIGLVVAVAAPLEVGA